MATGAEIAPLSQAMDGPAPVGTLGLGPLRIWPGGLCVSRSIGDKDVGPNIIATPHVRQVLVPEWGCRLIMASDGVWDCISKGVAVSTCKVRLPHACTWRVAAFRFLICFIFRRCCPLPPFWVAKQHATWHVGWCTVHVS